jgi:hypothetical protein
MTAQKDLANLLLSLFSADELRRWLRYLPGGDGLTGRLPGVNASPASLASEAVAELEHEGMIDEVFWGRLIEERPRRKADIDKVRGQVAASVTPVAAVTPSSRPLPQSTPEKITVLLVSASPKGPVRLRVDNEFRDVIGRMRATKHRDRFNFVQLQAARFDDLRTALLEHQPRVLHISAHGDEDGNLSFEGKGDAAQLVSQRQFTKLLAAVEGLGLVVLNACHSQVIAVKLPEVSGLAIGMSDAIADAAGIEFAVAFYEALGFGKSVDAALKLAVAGLDEADEDLPQLFPSAAEDTGQRRKAPLIT